MVCVRANTSSTAMVCVDIFLSCVLDFYSVNGCTFNVFVVEFPYVLHTHYPLYSWSLYVWASFCSYLLWWLLLCVTAFLLCVHKCVFCCVSRWPAVLCVPVFEPVGSRIPGDGAWSWGDGADESCCSSNWWLSHTQTQTFCCTQTLTCGFPAWLLHFCTSAGCYLPSTVLFPGRQLDKIKAEAQEKGDLGLVAESSRSNQRMMFQPASLTAAGVFRKLKEIASMSGNSVSHRITFSVEVESLGCTLF